MYQYNKKVVNMSERVLQVLVVLLTASTIVFTWLAVRNSKPPECLPYSLKVYEDNSATCLIKVQDGQ